MKNKFISIALIVVLAFSAMMTFTGCSDEEYPVQAANIVIESEPVNIVVLDAPTADIISYIGYDVKMVGRSDEVNQERMSVVPSVGTASNPDVEAIKKSDADIVFATEDLDDTAKDNLEYENIKVITMSHAKTPTQLQRNYLTIGRILGGNVKGASEGTTSYDNLLADMEEVKSSVNEVNNGVMYTVCYLFFENNSLRLMTSGTYGDMLLSYTGAVNAAVNIEENKVDVNTLKIANPNFIFYEDDETLNAIKADKVLSKLTAVKTGKTLMITSDEMDRQGYTALETLNKMVGFMYPALKTQTDATVPATTVPTQQESTTATTATTETTVPAETQTTTTALVSVANDYSIEVEGLSLKYEDENDNVKAVQQRLFDLGYVDDKENVTGYYGDVTKDAVTDFQKKNKITPTGDADNATIVAIFSSNAVKA